MAAPLPSASMTLWDQNEVDNQWQAFSEHLEQALTLALKDCHLKYNPDGQDRIFRTALMENKGVTKNKFSITETEGLHGTRLQPTSTFRERKIQRVLYRLAEMVCLERRCQQNTSKYQTLARRTSAWRRSFQTTAEACKHFREELQQLRDGHNKQRLAAWKHKLLKSDRACYRWLANEKITPNVCINQAGNAAESLLELRKHWKEVWDRPTNWQAAMGTAALSPASRALAPSTFAGRSGPPCGQQMSCKSRRHGWVDR